MSNTNEVQLAFVEESTWGTTPNSALQIVRHRGEGLRANVDSAISQEIEAGRQTTDVVRTSVGAGGPINFELSYGTYDEFLKALFFSAGWSTAASLYSGSAASVVGATGVISATGIDSSASVGQWVKIAGFANAENNGYFKILATASGTITVAGAEAMVDEATGQSVTVTMGSQIVNGTTQTSFSLEKKFGDLSNAFSGFVGSVIGGANLTIPSSDFLNGSFDFLAKNESDEDSTIGNGSYTAATTTKAMTAVENVDALIEGRPEVNSSNASDFTEVGVNFNNNLRERTNIGTLGAASIGAGRFEVSGTAQKYFDDSGDYAKFLNFTESAYAFLVSDAAGNAYILEFPALHYTSGQRVAGQANDDVLADFEWSAKKHSVEGIMARIVRFPA